MNRLGWFLLLCVAPLTIGMVVGPRPLTCEAVCAIQEVTLAIADFYSIAVQELVFFARFLLALGNSTRETVFKVAPENVQIVGSAPPGVAVSTLTAYCTSNMCAFANASVLPSKYELSWERGEPRVTAFYSEPAASTAGGMPPVLVWACIGCALLYIVGFSFTMLCSRPAPKPEPEKLVMKSKTDIDTLRKIERRRANRLYKAIMQGERYVAFFNRHVSVRYDPAAHQLEVIQKYRTLIYTVDNSGPGLDPPPFEEGKNVCVAIGGCDIFNPDVRWSIRGYFCLGDLLVWFSEKHGTEYLTLCDPETHEPCKVFRRQN